MRKRAVILAILGAFLAIGGGASARAECVSADDQALAAKAGSEVAQWEQRKGFQLTPVARSNIEREFCKAAVQLVDEGFEREAIADGAHDPVWAYLDQMITVGKDAVSLQDLVLADFVLRSDPALPEPRRMGVIRITYNNVVDTLRVSGKRMAPAPLLLAEVGSLSINGLSRGNIICSGTIRVSGLAAAAFTC